MNAMRRQGLTTWSCGRSRSPFRSSAGRILSMMSTLAIRTHGTSTHMLVGIRLAEPIRRVSLGATLYLIPIQAGAVFGDGLTEGTGPAGDSVDMETLTGETV